MSPSIKKVSSRATNGFSKCSMRTTASFIGGITICSSFTEPRSIDEMVKHRFVYRPHVEMSFCDSIEKHC